VTGTTVSSDFPTVNAIQASRSACTTACNPTGFVTKFNAGGSALSYSTYLGDDPTYGHMGSNGFGIAVDPTGSAYVTGQTFVSDFPVVNAFQNNNLGNSCAIFALNCGTAFVSQFSVDGRSLIYSTYLGGSGNGRPSGGGDVAASIAVDTKGNAYVTDRPRRWIFPPRIPFKAPITTPAAPPFVAPMLSSPSLRHFRRFPR
jgi:beta-propeller repeat-containing protein